MPKQISTLGGDEALQEHKAPQDASTGRSDEQLPSWHLSAVDVLGSPWGSIGCEKLEGCLGPGKELKCWGEE